MYRELAALDARRCRRQELADGSASTPTPCASTSSACARPAWSTSRPCTAAPSAAPSTSTSSPPARPGSASTRPRTRCSPGCSPRSPSASAPTPTTPPTTGRAWGAEAGRRTRSAVCLRGARRPSSTGSGSSPRAEPPTASRGRDRIEFLHCPFRELAEAYPELVCNLHRGHLRGRRRCRSAGEASRSSRRCTTPSRATSRSRSGILKTDRFGVHHVQCQDASIDSPSPTPRPTKVKELIEAEGKPELVLRVAVRPGGCSG